MRTTLFTPLKRTVMTLLLTVVSATTACADSWPDYITDVVVFATKEQNHESCIEKWEKKNYIVVKKDLNAGTAAFPNNFIYLAYKTDYRTSTNGEYITDFIVLNTSSPPETWNYNGRTYRKCPTEDNCDYGVSFDGNLNFLVTLGWNLYLYYTKDNFDDKRAVSSVTFNDTSSGSVNCWDVDNEEWVPDIDFNKGAGGDYIYMHMTTPTKTNRPQTDPYARGGLTYNGLDQVLMGGGTIESGKMYYRLGDTGEYVDDADEITARDVGTYTVYYYAGANDYSIESDVHSRNVTIGKSSNSNAAVSCEPTLVQDTPSPSVTGNLSTGAITYLYSSAEDGDYSTTIPSALGTWWVKANIAGDSNCDEYTTTPVSFSMTEANLVFSDNANNSSVIDNHNEEFVAATIDGRSLYKNDQWNTLCLPFNLDIEGSPLENATVKTLSSSSFDDGTLTLNFSGNLASIEAGKPYIVKWSPITKISSYADWNAFANVVASGADFKGETVSLTADIAVDKMVGVFSYPFRGTFEGNGHMLTFYQTTSEQYAAPFGHVDGATIRGLHVDGIITTSGKFAGGIIGRSKGNTTIDNCRSSITITSNIDGDGTHGGLIAQIENGQVNISDCLFDGTITGSTTTNCGGFVGWTESDNSATLNIQHCYFNPAEVNLGSGCKTFARARNSASVNINKGLYKTLLGDAQGIDARNMNIVTLWQNLGDEGWELSGTTLVPKISKATGIVNPLFSSVTIDKTLENIQTDYVDFIGSYDPVNIAGEDRTMLYLGADNSLYYPSQAMTINAFRGYFRLKGIEAGDPASGVREFVMNFDEDETTEILMTGARSKEQGASWYDLQGRKLSGKPTAKGLYINNGKKVVIK